MTIQEFTEMKEEILHSSIPKQTQEKLIKILKMQEVKEDEIKTDKGAV